MRTNIAFEIFTDVTVKKSIAWEVKLHGLVDAHRRFEGTSCITAPLVVLFLVDYLFVYLTLRP
jgi:hypothetical protein